MRTKYGLWLTCSMIGKPLKINGGDKELVVSGYVDASFDTDPDDSKSQTRYVFILNGGAVSWCSSKQSIME